MTLRRLVVLVTTLVTIAATAACGGDDTSVVGTDRDPTIPVEGATAVWSIDPAAPVANTAETFTAMVSRLECSGGVTGEVLAPEVTIGESEIVVVFSVAPLPPDTAYECPGNDLVPYEVDLGEPIGARALIDGACAGEAASTSFCADGDVRRPATG